MSSDGQHSDDAVVDEYPGSDLSISQLCLALKTKATKAIDSPRNFTSISSIASVEEDLATTTAVLRRVVNYHNSITHRLPAETLVAVASYLGDDKSLIAATYVSHHWRSTLLSFPLLWSRIDFKNEARALAFLERSKSTLLSIDLTKNRGPSQAVRESLEAIADRLIGLKGRYDEFLDQFLTQPLPLLRDLVIIESRKLGKPPLPTLPTIRSLATRNLGYPPFHVPNLTNFRSELSLIPPMLGDSLLEFLRSCPLLEVVFLSCGQKDRDIWFATDEASAKMISLPCLHSFTHDSPVDRINIELFNRLSVPPTCDVAFTVVISPSSIGDPWTYTFPPPRNPSHLSDIKTVKVTTVPQSERTPRPVFKVELLNSRNTKISFTMITYSYLYPTTPPSFPLMGFLHFLEAGGVVSSVETLCLGILPIHLQHENLPEDLTCHLLKFDSLKTLILWQCDSAPFLCNPPPPAVWCHTIQKLVICPLPPTHHRAAWSEVDVLKRVRDLAVSRKNCGTPLETVTVFSRDTEGLLRECGGDIEELRNSVESVEVVRFDGVSTSTTSKQWILTNGAVTKGSRIFFPAESSNDYPSCDDKEGHYIIVPDDVLARRYRTVRLLGQGTFAKIVEAIDTQTNERVAIKVIRAIPKYRDASKIEVRVLQKLKERDPLNRNKCILLLQWFDHRNHICIVSELLGMSVYDFLKENGLAPFPRHHIQSFARQLLGSVAFLHELHLIHTDLKPDNILLVHDESTIRQVPIPGKRTPQCRNKKVLESTDIRLIDFGSATFEEEYHSKVVTTRHYRAPEIILGLGWSYPCDAFSFGCTLVELYTGVTLFQTHDNLDHLAMMEIVMGRMPERFARQGARSKPKYFKEGSRLDWPKPKASRQSKKAVRSCRPLEEIIAPTDITNKHFVDLVRKLLTFDPSQRITIREALNHPYFQLSIPDET